MKIVVLLILAFASLQGYGQKKKKVDPKDLKIDSLTKASSVLSVQVDSLSKDRSLYYGLYTTIKEKILLTDFDPSKLSQIIDSLKQNKDTTISGLTSFSSSLKDTLSIVLKENGRLKAKLDSLTVAGPDKSKLVAELKELKGLLDAKIITQSEYDTKKNLVMAKWH